MIRLDQDWEFYKHVVLWTPQEAGKSADFAGLESQTSAANILNTSKMPGATPVILKPGQPIMTWERITITPRAPAASEAPRPDRDGRAEMREAVRVAVRIAGAPLPSRRIEMGADSPVSQLAHALTSWFFTWFNEKR